MSTKGGGEVKNPQKNVNLVYGSPLSRRRVGQNDLLQKSIFRSYKISKVVSQRAPFLKGCVSIFEKRTKKTVKTINSAVIFLTKNGFGIHIAHYTSKSFHVNSRLTDFGLRSEPEIHVYCICSNLAAIFSRRVFVYYFDDKKTFFLYP